MKMPPKLTLDKQCWQWAETTDPENVTLEHIRTAYRLNLPACKLGVCKRQCKGNPFCVNCIGEKVWFGKIDDDSWHDIQDPQEEMRKPGMFVGLKNLGATCYVNTFLQLWFHNETVRKGIYKWREMWSDTDLSQEWRPGSVCAHLQVIFGLLESSERRYIDPSEFIKHLGLDAGLQQDAQEFSKLFLSVLEENLQQGRTNSNTNVIKDQFCGQYAYVTRCSRCHNASERVSEFYELDLNIQGHKTLAESLKGFLEVEHLNGDNKYMCSHCNSKQDATRAIELRSLPPVLNLQLLRFVFDIKTGSKKKLNSCIQFPEVLDMTEFFPGNFPVIYDLNAVLIHRGPSAYSGHYVAHIKGKDSQTWYKFNDEEVEQIQGRNLQLGSEEELDGKKQKGTRTPKGHHSSKNAYMLVYTRRVANIPQSSASSGQNVPEYEFAVPCHSFSESVQCSSSTPCPGLKSPRDLCESASLPNLKLKNMNGNNNVKTSLEDDKNLMPEYVTKFVERDNADFEKWIAEMNSMKLENIAKGQEKQETVKAIYQDLAYSKDDGDKFEWIPMKWLSEWLADPSTAPAIKISSYKCDHGKLCPEQSVRMKCVSECGSDQLFSMYGGTDRLRGDNSLCLKCVQQKCHVIRTKQRILEDDKFISAVLKTDFSFERSFWVGKGSFRSWRRLAIEQLAEFEEKIKTQKCKGDADSADEETDANGEQTVGSSDIEMVENQVTQSASDSQIGVSGEVRFNDRSRSSGRKVKSESSIISSTDEKENVGNSSMSKANDFDIDCLKFNEDLLCEAHGGLDPDVLCRKLIPESVWLRLKRYFPDCAEFPFESPSCERCTESIKAENETKERNKMLASVQKADLADLFHDRKRPTSIHPTDGVYVVSTDFVQAWRNFVKDPVKLEPLTNIVNEILLCEHGEYLYPPPEFGPLHSDEKLTYISADEWKRLVVHFHYDYDISVICCVDNDRQTVVTFPKVCEECLVRRLSYEESEMFDYSNGVLYIRKQNKVDKMVENPTENSDSNLDDPEFQDKINSGSARKRSTGSVDAQFEPPEKALKNVEGCKVLRKSQRHRKTRGEKEINISSKQTLKDLKLKVMSLFSVPPFDQNLYVDGRLLTDNDKTLADLRVASGSVVVLVADEPQEGPSFLEEYAKASGIPESGFKGTNLLST